MPPDLTILRWVMLLPVVLVVFVFVALTSSIAADTLGFWPAPWAGACTAAAVVVCAWLMAPSHRRAVATGALLLGAAEAWQLLDPPGSTPESWGADGYQPTYLPVLGTYAGGLAAWLVLMLRRPPSPER